MDMSVRSIIVYLSNQTQMNKQELHVKEYMLYNSEIRTMWPKLTVLSAKIGHFSRIWQWKKMPRSDLNGRIWRYSLPISDILAEIQTFSCIWDSDNLSDFRGLNRQIRPYRPILTVFSENRTPRESVTFVVHFWFRFSRFLLYFLFEFFEDLIIINNQYIVIELTSLKSS